MKYILLAASIALLSTQAQAQGTPECYERYGSQQGAKACCDASFAKTPRGTMGSNAKRLAGIEACIAKPKKGRN